MARMQAEIQAQASDLVGIATGFARPDSRVFIQNLDTAAIHYAVSNDNRGTVCGWPYTAKKRGGKGYRVVPDLVGIPGHLMCEHCLKTERLIAIRSSNPAHVLSGDE